MVHYRTSRFRAVSFVPSSIMSKSVWSKRRVFRLLKKNPLSKRATITLVSLSTIIYLIVQGSHQPSRHPPNIPLPERSVKYGGAKIPFMLKPERDDEHMHGRHIAEINGIPHWTPTPLDFSAQTAEEKQKAHTNCSFNRLRSDSLPLDRRISDVRPKLCKKGWFYENTAKLPTTSVVIVFYNEPLSTLLRSIHSVLNRTPQRLLKEIILVDDGSDDNAPWLLEGGELDYHLDLLPKIMIARLKGRNGLMAARNSGASLASGDTITFLDSHVEVGPGWIQPLLGRIAEGLREGIDRVVVPSIDSIDADSFEYKRGGIDILGHSWGLTQTGLRVEINQTDPTPQKNSDNGWWFTKSVDVIFR
ncbi:Polypeptide N-acetylgalactosaminyltransferase 1 [Gracilariopsis chorda]|uniref:Polypeptide N-acetylgalactosaminyltransferase 1 n=1 Tax=Gracilariopsis chorda TaxID=448386 RepID=A0A2V3IBE7_9FLOR|nr:Polypeptide N-acetylgalactosaminyltransferase 1 [Gracilariopsis chorda]|eukprot:PXF39434.1 Polypeptide N-acetylgalactosaminyltransferase 1 [Gracilariopsis chorda]